MSHQYPEAPAAVEVFEDPVVQLAAVCPICALAVFSPAAALAALLPSLALFNPAVNPRAAWLAAIMPTAPAPRNSQAALGLSILILHLRSHQLQRSQ